MTETYCKTCGMWNTYHSNSDNGGCSECWDTENIVFEDKPEWEQIIEDEK